MQAPALGVIPVFIPLKPRDNNLFVLYQLRLVCSLVKTEYRRDV